MTQRVQEFFVDAAALASDRLSNAIVEESRGEHIDALSVVAPAQAADGRHGALVVLVTTVGFPA